MTGIEEHLAGGVTTLCRAWEIRRRDGVRLGFTDHDEALSFDGLMFAADTGLGARAVERRLGMAVDNSEVVGAISDAALREEDIILGRFDGAEVTSWLVNWQAPEMRKIIFRGTIGEIHREDGAFRAELRSLAAALDKSIVRTVQPLCGARLGDERCGVDLGQDSRRVAAQIGAVRGAEVDVLTDATAGAGAFTRGLMVVGNGRCAGVTAGISLDRRDGDGRRTLVLETAMPVEPEPGDQVTLVVGCDGTEDTCAGKFGNLLNFRGFPHVPGDDWRMRVPRSGGVNDGGALR